MTSEDHAEPRRKHPLRNDSIILLAMGFILFAAGIALVVAPDYSERARSLADFLARFAGLQSGVLVLGGLVFFSLGVLSRGITRENSSVRITSASPDRDDGVDLSPAIEQLADEMAQLGATVQQVSSDVGKASETLQHLLQAQDAHPHDSGHAQQPLEHDPLFRLASSLDQMNARLDKRMNELSARVDERIANLGDLLQAGAKGTGGSPLASAANGAEEIEVLLKLDHEHEAG